jgi:pimeloyl-ACP methyl ester carboxylesterase
MLEVIDEGSRRAGADAYPTPLLFVHGGWHTAQCWHNFLEFFADAGYRAVALSMQGHGASPADKPVRSISIADYVADVRTIADKLGGRPVLIGHSLGGFVVQRYLETRSAPAGVLVGAVPPGGVFGMALKFWRRHPVIAIKGFANGTLAGYVDTPSLAREHLFSPHTPEAIVESCMAQLGPESIRAAAVDSMFRPVKARRVTTPMLVLGAEHDGFVRDVDVRATARAYRTEPEFFAGMGHDMMLEPGWPDVAQRIHEWLQTRDLASQAG